MHSITSTIKNSAIYGICAIPLLVDLSFKAHRNNNEKQDHWHHHIRTQIVSGTISTLCYFGFIYGIRNKTRPLHTIKLGDLLASALLIAAPIIINPLTKIGFAKLSLDKKPNDKTAYLKHMGRGIFSGTTSALLAYLYQNYKN